MFSNNRTTTLKTLLATLVLGGLLIGCSKPKVIKNLSGESYQLRNADSTSVDFPGDFEGQLSVVSFIYTHCPNVCPVITANLKNIQSQLQDTSGIRFIEISFDPQRDTPSVLAKYKELYKLNDQFSMLTGDSTAIDTLMNRLDIYVEKIPADSMNQSSGEYGLRHSNRLYVMDENGRIRAQFPASVVPPEHVIEALQKLR